MKTIRVYDLTLPPGKRRVYKGPNPPVQFAESERFVWLR